MVATTHNYFQDDPHGSEQGGQDYGLIGGNISSSLDNATGASPTLDAYVSTSSAALWGASDDHFCCSRWAVGCKTPQTAGAFDPPAAVSKTEAAVHGWACDSRAARAGAQPISVALTVDGGKAVHVVANVSRPDVVHTWDRGSCTNNWHGFRVNVTLARDKKHTLRAYGMNAAGGGMWELQGSPRCLSGEGSPVPC